MRLSTLQFNQNAIMQLLNKQSKIFELQNQIATGKKFTNLSDDPVAATKADALKKSISITEQFNDNAIKARHHNALLENNVSNVINVILRVRELHIRSTNDTLTDSDRNVIKQEITSLKEELASIANSRDEKGSYLYGGFKSSSIPYTKNASGAYIYQGDDGSRSIDVASGFRVKIADSGFDVFDSIREGNGDFTVTDKGGANTGSAIAGPGDIFDKGQYVKDTYTVTFVTNSAGELAYQVVGATSGQIVPALPLTIPNDAPKYVDGQDIQFNGHSLNMSGTPQVGDDFEIKPAASKNIFSVMDDFLTNLATSQSTSAQKASLSTRENQSLIQIDQALDHFTNYQTKLGSRLNVIDTAENLNLDFVILSKETLGDVENLDLVDAIMRLNMETTSLQAAQQSFVRLQSLTLLNYL